MSGQSETGLLVVPPAETPGWWPCVAALLPLAKPGIVAAEVAAALTGLLLVSPTPPAGATVSWTVIVVVLAAGGAAMANGLIEKASDRMMPRLAARCLALERAGEKLVRTVATVAMVTSLILAATFLNPHVALLLGTAMGCYVWFYTACLKRTSPLALLVGGIPGALPPLIGAAAVDSFAAPALLLAAVIYCWQLSHFWFLALHYQKQYRQAGVPVFPLVYGEQLTRRLILAVTALLIPITALFRFFGTGFQVTVLILLCGLTLLAGSVWALREQSRYRSGFLASLVYLVLLFTLLAADLAGRWQIFGDLRP